MRLYQLVREDRDVVIHNELTGHTMVLTPQGAVYNTEDTLDLRNMSIAFGVLITSEMWREATEDEILQLRLHPPTLLLEVQWALPNRDIRRPHLSVIKGGKPKEEK